MKSCRCDMKDKNLKAGDVAISRAGHDAGRVYLIVKIVGEDFCLAVDGKIRKLDNPKVKRFKHLDKIDERADLAESLDKAKITDKAVSAELKNYTKQGR